MFRARIHAKVRDPVWWAMTLCFIAILLWFSSKELTMAYLLYSPDALAHRVLHENYPLYWIYGTHGYITGIEAFSDTDSFMQKFIPVYTASYSDLVLQGIAKSTNVMILMHLFPPLYLARRIANGECLQLISIGHTRTKVFWGMLMDTVFHMALLFLFSGTLTWIASSWGYLKWDLEIFLHCQILRLPMLIAWLMPTVFVCFLTQNMLLSSLIGFGLMVFQGNIARIFVNLNLFPALTYTQNIAFTSFWTTAQSAEKIGAYLWPCFATIAFWSLISYIFFLARPLRFVVR